jgi:hypothetical protein
MGLQRWRVLECDVLSKPGIQSRQLVWPKNSPESQAKITHVTMEPGSVSERHAHACSSRSGLLSVEKASCYLEMNKLKFFALAILFALQQKKYMV